MLVTKGSTGNTKREMYPSQFRTSFLVPIFLLLVFGAWSMLIPKAGPSKVAPSIDEDLWGVGNGVRVPKDPCIWDLPPDTLFSATDTGGGVDGAPETKCPTVQYSMPPLTPEIPCPPYGITEESPGGATGSPGVAGVPDPYPTLPFDGAGGIPNGMNPGRGPGTPLDSLFVNAASGELSQSRTDLRLPGTPFQFVLARIYYSTNAGYNGVMGDGWELNALQRVRVTQSDPFSSPPGKPTLFWVQEGNGRDSAEFSEMPTVTDWYSASGRNDQVQYFPATQNEPNRLVRYLPNGTKFTYSQLGAGDHHYHITRSEDMWGNSVEMQYINNAPNASTAWTLDKAIDDLGREFRFTYDSYHGRLIEVAAFDGSTQIAAANYSYEEKPDGTILLVKAETGYSATDNGSGALLIKRVKEEYGYDLIDSQLNPYTRWRLSSVSNGEGEIVHSWEYDALGDDSAVVKQVDRPGSQIRSEGVHQYSYNTSTNTTEYTSPDGHRRDFVKDSQGRIWKRVEYPNPQNLSETLIVTFEYDPGCISCNKISKITFPDGSYRVFQFDNPDGQLTAIWLYPPVASGLPPRVERWSHSLFNPSAGFMRKRMLEHELQRDANPIEDPTHPCNHPSCDDLQGVDGHIVHTYTWSSDEKSLVSLDFGSIQTTAGSSPSMLSRSATYEYFSDGRLKAYREFEDGTEVSRTDFVLDISKVFVASSTVHDSILGDSWTTSYTRTPSTYFLDSITDERSVTTKLSLTSSGQVYLIQEDWTSGTGSERTTSLWYDSAGRLVRTNTNSGTEAKQVIIRLDESGAAYEVETLQAGFPARLTKLDISPGGLLLSTEDWRGWKSTTEYGFGSLALPQKVTETYGGQSRDIWKAGDGGQDAGYDDMGRLTSFRNVADWKSYQLYDHRGRLASTHQQTDATHYSSRAFFYDARGHLREREVGSINGNPQSATPSQFTWLQHIVYVHNLAGHLLSEAVYESGPQGANSRLIRYQTDGRGRPVLTTRYQGNKAQAPVAVVEETTYDALNRIFQVRQLAAPGSATAVRILDAWYLDSTGVHSFQETLESGAKTKIDLTHDDLGRLVTRAETPWVSGSWGASRTWAYTYDGFDNPKSVTNPYGVRTEWDGTDLGQLKEERVVRNDGLETQITTYDYSTTDGSLVSITDAEGKMTSYQAYTSDWLRPHKVTYPDGRIFEILGYDNLGRRTSTLDDRGIVHAYSYDYSYLEWDIVTKPQNQVVPGPDARSWNYDRDKGTLLKSRVWENQVAIWQTDFTHNDLGEKLSETQGAGSSAMTWSWNYGYLGELLEVTYPTGLGIDKGYLGYDAAGRVSNLIYEKGASQLSNESLEYDGYRLEGRNDSVSGLEVDFRFDDFGRMDKISWAKQVGGSPVLLDGQERAFDVGDHVVARQRVLDAVGDVFVHDGYGRMKDWYEGVSQAVSSPANTQPSSWTDAEYYSLNKVFARTTVTKEIGGVMQPPEPYVTNNAHFYTSVDGEQRTVIDGRLNGDNTHFYGWDAWGRLSTVTNIQSGVVIRRHHYDSSGRRVRTEYSDGTASSVSRLVYWGSRLAATFTEGASKSDIRTYGYAGGADGEAFVEVSASGAANGSYALAKDFQGTVLAIVDRSTLTVVERYRYDIFGEVAIEDGLGQPLTASAYGNNRFFLGRPYDEEIEIYDLRARWYQPRSGSFLSPDPLGAIDSPNLFQYGFGSPGTWMDPFGLSGDGGGEVTWYTTPVGEGLDVAIGADGTMRDFSDVIENEFDWDDGAIIDDPELVDRYRAEMEDNASKANDNFNLGLKILGEVLKDGLSTVVPMLLGDASDACVVAFGYDIAGNKVPRWAGALGLILGSGAQWSQAKSALSGVADMSPNTIGRVGENAVKSFHEIGGKVKIPINGRSRIPDGLTNSVLTEIKNVKTLSYTRQLRDFADYAKAKGLDYHLYVRKSTELSGPLKEAIEGGAIELRFIPGSK